MAVYVDELADMHWKLYGRGVKSCHLLADTEQELHDAAKLSGLKRSYFQGKGSLPHYDIVASKRAQAVKNGAFEIKRECLLEAFDNIRKNLREGKWWNDGRKTNHKYRGMLEKEEKCVTKNGK